MWVVLNDAFLSIVADKNDPTKLLVRSRVHGDIEKVFPDAQVTVTPPPKSDYMFRASIDRAVVAKALASRATAIGYSNFKDSVKQKWRHDAYFSIWSIMASVQDRIRRGG